MFAFDALLGRTEKQQADHDPVKQAQRALQPVRDWATKSEQEFQKAAAKLKPRLDATLKLLNRVTRLAMQKNLPRAESTALWQQINDLLAGPAGIPASFRHIVEEIDGLTPYLVSQRIYLVKLQQKRTCPPGTIGHVIALLDRLEMALEQDVAILAAAPVRTDSGLPRHEQAQTGVKVETAFPI